MRHERVREAVVVAAGTALPVDDSDGDVEYLQRSATAVTSVPGPGSDPLTAAIGAVDVLRFGLAVGQSALLVDRTVAVDLDGDGRIDSADVRAESTFVGVESVTTPAGSFGESARVRAVVRTTARLAGAPQPVTVTMTVDEWFAPGVGPVRSSTTTVGDGVARRDQRRGAAGLRRRRAAQRQRAADAGVVAAGRRRDAGQAVPGDADLQRDHRPAQHRRSARAATRRRHPASRSPSTAASTPAAP